MAVVVTERGGRAPRVRHRLCRIVGKIAKRGRALLGRSAQLQPAKAIVDKASYLARLIALRDLIPRIVAVGSGRIDGLVPIQLVGLLQAAQDVLSEFPAASALVSYRDDFTSRAATSAICVFARRAIGER